MRSFALDRAKSRVVGLLQEGQCLDAAGAHRVAPFASLQWARDTLKELARAKLIHVAELRSNRRGRPTPVYAWGDRR